MILEFDDFGCDHTISDMCQSHDCRDALEQLHKVQPKLKVTLFAIPGEMTQELLNWSEKNKDWIELAVHGFYHSSNYECEKMTYIQFAEQMELFEDMIEEYFVKGFRAPGWQISDEIYTWLLENGWWVADQGYNNDRRPLELPTYLNSSGFFHASNGKEPFYSVIAWHGHTWNCVGNGIYESFDHLSELIKTTDNFQFVSEVMS